MKPNVSTIVKGSIVKHPRTGQEAVFISQWINPWGQQIVVNVRLCDSNLVTSWNTGLVVNHE